MNRKVQVYIEGQRIELFNDEEIQVSSTIQNVADISKTYTDFSQSFTIPASTHNNKIIQHFYQSDVNSLIDYNLRLDSFIEIELNFFRRGKLHVEKANIKNGRPESYTVTFYGDGRTLKDYFGEDLLSDLDFTALSHNFTSAEVIDRIEDNTNAYDVKYPLITSNRIWEYQSTPVNSPLPNWLTSVLTSNDIHTTSGAINKEELFPAVRVKKIFEAIETKYGITFDSAFINDERFTKLFLWFKGKETLVKTSYGYDLTATTVVPTFTNYDLTSAYTSATNTVQVQELAGIITHRLIYNVTSTTSSENYYIDIYQNGNLFNTILGSATGSYVIDNIPQVVGLDTSYTFKIRTAGANTIQSNLVYEVDSITTGTVVTDYLTVTYSSLLMALEIDLSANAPIMKVSEFFSGILKVFNMVCVGTSENVYQLSPLDDWYGQGAIVDITRYSDVSSIDVQRMPLYKKIQFKFTDSDCLLNKNFSQTFNRNYGDTSYQYNYDGGEFTLDVPFENLLQTKFNGTQELQLGYSLNSQFSPYIPKPVIFYQYNNKVSDFKFKKDGGGHETIITYTPFGQDLRYNNTDLTLNFAPETSSLLEIPIQQTSFALYYFSYLYNLYNLKQRLISVKTILPVGLLTELKLNDRLIIRDKRYIINSMQSNLTTGEVNFQLILDFRPMVNQTIQPYVNVAGGVVSLPVNFINNAVSAIITSSNADVIISPSTLTSSQMVAITLPSGTAGTVYDIATRFTLSNGDTETQTTYIIQR